MAESAAGVMLKTTQDGGMEVVLGLHGGQHLLSGLRDANLARRPALDVCGHYSHACV